MTNKYLEPRELERYSFLWSEVRLVVAAAALLLGGVPPLLLVLPSAETFGAVWLVLKIAWIISGAASAYLLYQWFQKRRLFGKKDTRDTVAFFVSIVSGLNLGITGILGQNIGMSLVSNSPLNYPIFVIAAVVYLAAAFYLFQQWKGNGQKLFD